MTETPLPPLPARDAIGFKVFDAAKSNRSKCYICEEKVLRGQFRFHYRVKESTSLRDELWVHASCVPSLPVASCDNDIVALRSFIVEATGSGDEEALTALRTALADRRRAKEFAAEAAAAAGSAG